MKISSLANETGLYSLLELDRTTYLAELLSLDLSLPDNVEIIKKIKKLLLPLTKEVTAAIFDPVYSFDLLSQKAKNCGSLIRLEQNKEFLPNVVPELFPAFSLEEVKNNYSLAKLELAYHPQEEKAMEKKQLLAEIKDYCDSLGIDFLLKLKVYDHQKFIETEEELEKKEFSKEETQLAAIQELRSFAHLIALESPEDPLLLATISSDLDSPWLVFVDQEMSYEEFKDRFRMAMDNGASGYVLGDLLWREIGSFRLEDQSPDLEAIEKFIDTTVRDRVMELNRIASEILAK